MLCRRPVVSRPVVSGSPDPDTLLTEGLQPPLPADSVLSAIPLSPQGRGRGEGRGSNRGAPPVHPLHLRVAFASLRHRCVSRTSSRWAPGSTPVGQRAMPMLCRRPVVSGSPGPRHSSDRRSPVPSPCKGEGRGGGRGSNRSAPPVHCLQLRSALQMRSAPRSFRGRCGCCVAALLCRGLPTPTLF